MFNTEEGAHHGETFSGELSTVVSKDIRLDAVRDVPMIEEDIGNVRGTSLEHWDRTGQLEISIGNDKFVLATLCCFGKRSNDIHSDKVKLSRCWEELQSTMMAELGFVSCPAWACAYDVIDVCGHVGLGKVAM